MSENSWLCCSRTLEWVNRTLIMGILNVTPDSFSDGGQFYDTSQAISHAYQLFEDGADVIDIGGESTRPGAEKVPEEEELRRVIPVIEEIAGNGGQTVSIDTVKYNVAAKALEAGASIINDVSGLQQDPRLAELAADSCAGLIIMHMRGTPKTMQSLVHYENLLGEIRDFFQRQTQLAINSSVKKEQIVLDPGIGFSKTAEHNLQILNRLSECRFDNYPLLLGVSRKSFIGKITGQPVDNRLLGTAAAVAACLLNGANMIRVHDVGEMREVVGVIDAIRKESIP